MALQSLSRAALAVVFSLQPVSGCSTNATHVGWRQWGRDPLGATSRNLKDLSVRCQCRKKAEEEALDYLKKNVMVFDEHNLETLGFPSDGTENVDGLDDGLVGPSVSLAFDAKQNYTWTDALPKDVFYEYVLNYANVNEPRNNWRPLLLKTIQPLIETRAPNTTGEVVRVLNKHMWTQLAPRHSESIVFVSGQTPLIFDPMSTLAFGYASCTGMAVLFVDALRTAGVAARVAGVPAWNGNRSEGNHNWVEVYSEDGEWRFMEPSPAQKAIDDLDQDPCKRWFCHADRFQDGKTQVYAARLDQEKAETHFRLAWEWNSTGVPGVDRTEFYTNLCSECK